MSFTVINRLVVLAAFASAVVGAGPSVATTTETEATPVALLYKDFAWQAFASQADLFGEDIAHQSKGVLEKYFAPELAALLVQDAVCQARSGGICNLDFDLLFNSQDPNVSDLDIATHAPGKVSVEFKNPVNQKKSVIEFVVAKVGGRWRIADALYRQREEPSLRKTLLRKVPATHRE